MRALPLALFALLLPTAVLAHTGHESGTFLAGAGHPIGGLDHVLAMVALGLLAAQKGGASLWAMPLSFVTAMVLGGALGFAGLPFPAVEPLILASIVLFGVLVALAARLPLMATLPLIALFGAAHGWAHGAEGPATGIAAYALGFAAMTAALHLAGIALGRVTSTLALRGLGAAAALAGVALALS